ncbi:unnamed protein product [Diabrotica balteata]|uniref:Uncharacterized protein n=1 Tax=Diabrotica balteata TaxID=107213 RepID=A0A9N9SPG9_DIABA|nr:unnamed protein product [Diabrotica balteata]
MEFKVEIKEHFVECNQKNIESKPSTSIGLKNFQKELEDDSEMESKAKIKEEFAEGCQGYNFLESQLFTSPDEDLINKADEDNSGNEINNLISNPMIKPGETEKEDRIELVISQDHCYARSTRCMEQENYRDYAESMLKVCMVCGDCIK